MIAVDSADPAFHGSFQSNHCRVYQGSCYAILRSTAASGLIKLTATATDLPTATVEFGGGNAQSTSH
jgi:hypothetical protein